MKRRTSAQMTNGERYATDHYPRILDTYPSGPDHAVRAIGAAALSIGEDWGPSGAIVSLLDELEAALVAMYAAPNLATGAVMLAAERAVVAELTAIDARALMYDAMATRTTPSRAQSEAEQQAGYPPIDPTDMMQDRKAAWAGGYPF